MEALTPVVTIILQLLIGKLIKLHPGIANGLIFWINWVVGVLSNLGLNALVVPADASVGSATHSAVAIISNPFVLSFIQTVLATGIHSASKNTWEMIKGTVGIRII